LIVEGENKMSKIAMYSTGQLFGKRVSGGFKRFLELYNGLKSREIDVDLFCTDSPKVLKEKRVSAYSLINEEKSKNLFIPTEFKIFIKNIATIKKIKNDSYDSIIVFDVPTAIGLCLVGLKNIQLFIRQDLIGYRKIAISERAKSKLIISSYLGFMKFCETICFVRAERIVIQCKYDYDAIIKRHRFIRNIIKKKSIIQINNVNPSWIVDKSMESKVSSREFEKKNESNKFVVGFIGGFSNERKGHRIFVDAIKNLSNKGLGLEAILVGDGKQLLAYKNECINYPTIKFTGRLDNPITIIKKCDLMVVPSLADSCPNTVMEAFYNEIPVIGARSGGIPEILKSDISLFDIDSQSLQNRIKNLLKEENLSEFKKEQILRKKELTFDWVKKIIECLKVL